MAQFMYLSSGVDANKPSLTSKLSKLCSKIQLGLLVHLLIHSFIHYKSLYKVSLEGGLHKSAPNFNFPRNSLGDFLA